MGPSCIPIVNCNSSSWPCSESARPSPPAAVGAAAAAGWPRDALASMVRTVSTPRHRSISSSGVRPEYLGTTRRGTTSTCPGTSGLRLTKAMHKSDCLQTHSSARPRVAAATTTQPSMRYSHTAQGSMQATGQSPRNYPINVNVLLPLLISLLYFFVCMNVNEWRCPPTRNTGPSPG